MKVLKDILSKVEGQGVAPDTSFDWSEDILTLQKFRDIDNLEYRRIGNADATITAKDIEYFGWRISRIYTLYANRKDLLEVVDEMLPILAKMARKWGAKTSEMKYRKETGKIFFKDCISEEFQKDDRKCEALMKAIKDILVYETNDKKIGGKHKDKKIGGKHKDKEIDGEHDGKAGMRTALVIIALEELKWIKPIGRIYTIKNWRRIFSVLFSSNDEKRIEIGSEEAINRIYREKSAILEQTTEKNKKLYWYIDTMKDQLTKKVK